MKPVSACHCLPLSDTDDLRKLLMLFATELFTYRAPQLGEGSGRDTVGDGGTEGLPAIPGQQGKPLDSDSVHRLQQYLVPYTRLTHPRKRMMMVASLLPSKSHTSLLVNLNSESYREEIWGIVVPACYVDRLQKPLLFIPCHTCIPFNQFLIFKKRFCLFV